MTAECDKVRFSMVDIFDMWGKSIGDINPTFRPLIYHMIDVASVAQAMWDCSLAPIVKTELSGYLKLEEDDAKSWIGLWAGLHDIGKATPAFQAKKSEAKTFLQSKGYRFRSTPSEKPHGLMTAYLISEIFRHHQTLGLPSDLLDTVCYALGGHHGIFPDDRLLSTANVRDAGDGEWVLTRAKLVDNLADICEVKPYTTPKPAPGIDGPFFTILSGLTSVADWIGSSEEYFWLDSMERDLTKYATYSRGQAHRALEHLRWNASSKVTRCRTFHDAFSFVNEPYPMQRRAIELADALGSPGLIIVEAPMGEGKTEAALYLAERWCSVLGHDGFYIALPTQATADQMFSRTISFLKGSDKKVNLALLHGHAVLSEEYQQIRIADEEPDEPGYQVAAGEWFTHRKRAILSPYGVGTIDQALLSVLPTKHYFVRLFGLAGKVVIIDEVHSYDLYMSTLLDRLLVWLKAIGSSVILLSATLPISRRNDLLSAYSGHKTTVQPQPYPRLSWVLGDAEGGASFPSASSLLSGRPHEISLIWIEDNNEAIFGKIEGATVEGGTAAIICNTVAKAQSTYAFLKERLSGGEVDVDLLHARYPYGQRKLRQDRVLANFGKAERDPKKKRVLVATQIIEQSLDLDFDFMLTELAPVDLILQRLGRLHRHNRAKRAAPVAFPALCIIEPRSMDAGPPDYGSSKHVYSEHILLRSHLSLREKHHIQLPADIEYLVEKVYGENGLATPGDAWDQRLAESKKDWKEEMARKMAKGNARVVPLPSYERPWDATRNLLKEDDPDIHQNLQAQTRDSLPNVMLICLYGNDGALSLDPEGINVVDLSHEPSSKEIPELLDRAVTVSHPAVARFFKDQPTPHGWRQSSLLSHYKAAVFSKVYGSAGHYCDCGGKCLVLTDELGLSTKDGGVIEL